MRCHGAGPSGWLEPPEQGGGGRSGRDPHMGASWKREPFWTGHDWTCFCWIWVVRKYQTYHDQTLRTVCGGVSEESEELCSVRKMD